VITTRYNQEINFLLEEGQPWVKKKLFGNAPHREKRKQEEKTQLLLGEGTNPIMVSDATTLVGGGHLANPTGG